MSILLALASGAGWSPRSQPDEDVWWLDEVRTPVSQGLQHQGRQHDGTLRDMPGSEERRRQLDQQAKTLRRHREEADVGLRQLARALNCQHSFLSQVETGKMIAPEWLRHAYAELTAGTPLHCLDRQRGDPAPGRREPLLRQRLAIDEEVVVTLSPDGSVERFLHRLCLRAVSSNVPAVFIRDIAAEQLDEWGYRELEGGTLAVGHRISGRIDLGIKFPVPLKRREEHFVTLLLDPPPGDYSCFRWPTTHYGLRRLSIRLWQSPSSEASVIIRRIDGTSPHGKLDLDRWPHLHGTSANGLTAATFATLCPGFGYGLVWVCEH